MLRRNKRGEYIIDSLEKLSEWYKLAKEDKPADKSKVKAPKKKSEDNKSK